MGLAVQSMKLAPQTFMNRSGRSVEAAIDRLAFAPGGAFAPDRIVNVLELNMALDKLGR